MEPEAAEPERPIRAHEPPAKEIGLVPAYAAAYADVLPKSHREALRSAAIVYLDQCYDALREGKPGESYADTAIAWFLPSRYEHYYDGRFARDWTITVGIVGWKLAQSDELKLSCVAEELALWALIKQAEVQLEIHDEVSDKRAWGDFRDFALEDEDFLFLFTPEFDGIEETEWARQHAVVGLKFSEWFQPFDSGSHGAPHPFTLD